MTDERGRRDGTSAAPTSLERRRARQLETVGRLAGGVAHDLNNLLMVIMGYGELLMAGLEDRPSRKEEARQIWNAGKRAASLTRRLLALGREGIREPRVLEPNRSIEETRELMRRLVREDIEIDYVLDPALGRVEADPMDIERLLVTLLVHASDVMPDGGRIVVETANVTLDEQHAVRHGRVPPGPYVRLAVTDSRAGMLHDEPAEREDDHGLSFACAIVEESGGHVRVESEPGRGTRFEAYLPRVRRGLPSTEDEAISSALLPGTETVLVVEDAGAVRDLVGEVLRRCGYVVLEAEEPRQASTLSRRHPGPIHLLLTDVVMPGMSGRELADRVRTHHRDIKTLYMSGHPADHVAGRGVPDEGAAFVAKPVTPGELARKVREILDRDAARGGGGSTSDRS